MYMNSFLPEHNLLLIIIFLPQRQTSVRYLHFRLFILLKLLLILCLGYLTRKTNFQKTLPSSKQIIKLLNLNKSSVASNFKTLLSCRVILL